MHNRSLPQASLARATALLTVAVLVVTPVLSAAPAALAAAPSGNIAITEVLANVPTETGDEVVELLNVGQEPVDLATWQLSDGGSLPLGLVAYPRAVSVGTPGTVLPPGAVALVLDKDYAGGYDAAIAAAVDAAELVLLTTSSGNLSLANTADSVAVLQPGGTTSDSVAWTKDAGEGAALARRLQADGTLADAAIDEEGPSLGIVREEALPPTALEAPQVRLSELLPDPVGSDDGEFIEVEVLADATLDGLLVRDAAGTTHPLEGLATAGAYVVVPRTASGIALNNTGDSVSLLWSVEGQVEQLLDSVTYGNAPEGSSHVRFTDAFAWSTTPTPGAANVLTQPAPPAGAEEEPDEPIEDEEADEAQDEAELPVEVAALRALRDATDGSVVKVMGTVVTEPGQFHAAGFYVADDGAGVLVVPSSGSDQTWLDDVRVGQSGSIVGTLTKPKSGVRLTVAAAPALEAGAAATPVPVELGELSRNDVGRLVQVSGTVARRSGKSFRVADKENEVLVSVRKGSGITAAAPAKGSAVSVAGVVLASGTGVAVAPRSSADLSSATSAGSGRELVKTGPAAPALLLSLAALAATVAAVGRAATNRYAASSGRSVRAAGRADQ